MAMVKTSAAPAAFVAGDVAGVMWLGVARSPMRVIERGNFFLRPAQGQQQMYEHFVADPS